MKIQAGRHGLPPLINEINKTYDGESMYKSVSRDFQFALGLVKSHYWPYCA